MVALTSFRFWVRAARSRQRQLPGPGDGFAVVDLKSVGARLVNSELGPAIQFAIHTFDTRAHPNYPAEFDIYIDANRDGDPDYVVFNSGGRGICGDWPECRGGLRRRSGQPD